MTVFTVLYQIEREHKTDTPEQRYIARQQKALPIWKDFGHYLQQEHPELKKSSAIHKAFVYTMKRFKRLSRYMDNGILHIDSNWVENSIRPVTLGYV